MLQHQLLAEIIQYTDDKQTMTTFGVFLMRQQFMTVMLRTPSRELIA